MGTVNEFQRNNCCKKPEEAAGKARAAISLPECKAEIAHRRGLERQKTPQPCPGDVAEDQKPECRLLPSYPSPNLGQSLTYMTQINYSC